jgi:hypothetical protein
VELFLKLTPRDISQAEASREMDTAGQHNTGGHRVELNPIHCLNQLLAR